MEGIGKLLLVLGCILVLVGLALIFGPKIPYLGKLPGDIHVKKQNFEFYFPVATSIVVSVLLTLAFWVISYFGKKR
jgi:hypothetical protein